VLIRRREREGNAVQDLQTSIVGRDDELGAVGQFVDNVNDGPASLVLEGLAGIGKTTIWKRAVADAIANGVTVWTCRCSESDGAWEFSGLGDLLDGLASEALAELPAALMTRSRG
jgi:hypothetical protein